MLPTKPLNTDYLHQYSRELALQLSNKFFAQTDIITGEQIVEFSDIKQINFLVLKILEERWEAEAARLESSFFDYSHADVQDGLRTFLNVLSQHIRVQRKTFTTVLIEAIFGTLQLVLDPRSFYEQEIQKNAKIKLTAEHFRRIIKYLQYNREIFKTFVGELALRYPHNFQAEDAVGVWQNTLRDHWRYIEPIEWRIKAFNNLLPIDLDDIYTRAFEVVEEKTEPAQEESTLPAVEEKAEEVVETLPAVEEKAEEVVETLPAVEEKAEEIVETLPAVEEKVEEVVEILPAVEEKVEEIAKTLPAVEEKVEEVIETLPADLPTIQELIPPFDTEEDKVVSSYFEHIQENIETPTTLVLPIEKPVTENIVSQYRQDKVGSLLEAIPLHEKFTFIDELFGGDNLAFQDALEKIDKSPNYEEARRLTNQYILQHNWDFDQDSTQEFLAWLGRRF